MSMGLTGKMFAPLASDVLLFKPIYFCFVRVTYFSGPCTVTEACIKGFREK
jgi:hypothetical protein